MMKRSFIALFCLPIWVQAQQQLSLEDCYNLAHKNYPLAKQIDLFKQKSDLQVNSNNKGKLPKMELNAQGTYQNQVPEVPGQKLITINKAQYKGSFDFNQLIYNGGLINANSKLIEAQTKTQQQKVEVDLYQLKSRINQLYFSVLLLQEQKEILLSKQDQLLKKIKEVQSGIQNGAILPASEKVLQAENLKIKQQFSEIKNDRKTLLENLSTLTYSQIEENTSLVKPEFLTESNSEILRPELDYFKLQQNQIEASKTVLSKNIYPKVSAFANAGFGNPGLNFIYNSLQPIFMTGLRLNWNFFDWNKTKLDKEALAVSAEMITNEKETFLLNTRLQSLEFENQIKKIEESLVIDSEIIELRKQVEQSAGSQLKNGAITTSDYLIEFTNLFEAQIQQKIHEIQLALAKANFKVNKGS